MRKKLDTWRLYKEGESKRKSLARLFIAMDELRSRMNPETYPNFEISDEGYLWFNVPSEIGTWEIFCMPHGLQSLSGPGLVLSFPHRLEEMTKEFVDIIDDAVEGISDVTVFAVLHNAEQILNAYNSDEVPDLHLLRSKDTILKNKYQGDFFSYFGIYLRIIDKDVRTSENIMLDVISKMDEKKDMLTEQP